MKDKTDQMSLPPLSAPPLYLITSFLKNGGGPSPLHQSFFLAFIFWGNLMAEEE